MIHLIQLKYTRIISTQNYDMVSLSRCDDLWT